MLRVCKTIFTRFAQYVSLSKSTTVSLEEEAGQPIQQSLLSLSQTPKYAPQCRPLVCAPSPCLRSQCFITLSPGSHGVTGKESLCIASHLKNLVQVEDEVLPNQKNGKEGRSKSLAARLPAPPCLCVGADLL